MAFRIFLSRNPPGMPHGKSPWRILPHGKLPIGKSTRGTCRHGKVTLWTIPLQKILSACKIEQPNRIEQRQIKIMEEKRNFGILPTFQAIGRTSGI